MNTTQIGEGENKIQGQTLAFLIKLFKEGKITLGVDDDGFVFKNAGGHYPVEIYEDGHWDGSLSQGLSHQKREENKTKPIYTFVDDKKGGGVIVECSVCEAQFDVGKGTEYQCPSCKTDLVYPEYASW